MKNTFAKFGVAIGSILLPAVAFAQGTTIESLLIRFRGIINIAIPLLVAVAIAYFIFSIIKYVGAKDEEAQAAGRKMMLNAIIALFVVLSLWGLVKFIQNSLGITGGQVNSTDLPNVN